MSMLADARAASRPRPMGFLMVLAAHVALGWLLVDGLGLRLAMQPPPPPFEARVIEERPASVEPAPLPVPRTGAAWSDVELEPPEFVLDADTTTPAETITATTIDPGADADVAAPPRRSAAGPDPRHPLTQPRYPPQSVRLGEEGTVALELRVGTDGRVREARVLQSSGYPRLDAAAVAEALRVWRLRPATLDDAPVEAWHAVRVSFRLDRH